MLADEIELVRAIEGLRHSRSCRLFSFGAIQADSSVIQARAASSRRTACSPKRFDVVVKARSTSIG